MLVPTLARVQEARAGSRVYVSVAIATVDKLILMQSGSNFQSWAHHFGEQRSVA